MTSIASYLVGNVSALFKLPRRTSDDRDHWVRECLASLPCRILSAGRFLAQAFVRDRERKLVIAVGRVLSVSRWFSAPSQARPFYPWYLAWRTDSMACGCHHQPWSPRKQDAPLGSIFSHHIHTHVPIGS